jgi:hypothetical protein
MVWIYGVGNILYDFMRNGLLLERSQQLDWLHMTTRLQKT